MPSTNAGASAMLGAMDSIKCWKDQTPPAAVRAGSSTTPTSRIMSSRSMSTAGQVCARAVCTKPTDIAASIQDVTHAVPNLIAHRHLFRSREHHALGVSKKLESAPAKTFRTNCVIDLKYGCVDWSS